MTTEEKLACCLSFIKGLSNMADPDLRSLDECLESQWGNTNVDDIYNSGMNYSETVIGNAAEKLLDTLKETK